MKKVLAIALAIVLAFSMSAIAFAEDQASWTCPGCGNKFYKEESYESHAQKCLAYNALYTSPATSETHWEKTCPKCSKIFFTPEAYNDHLDSNGDCNGTNAILEGLTIMELVNKLVETFDINSAQWEQVEDILIRLIDMIENLVSQYMGTSQEDVEGAVADLEGKIDSMGLIGSIKEYVENIINTLKQKIKDFYAGEQATEVEETEAEVPAETGSSMVGVAAFAAVSVACAAAYVCTKKKN